MRLSAWSFRTPDRFRHPTPASMRCMMRRELAARHRRLRPSRPPPRACGPSGRKMPGTAPALPAPHPPIHFEGTALRARDRPKPGAWSCRHTDRISILRRPVGRGHAAIAASAPPVCPPAPLNSRIRSARDAISRAARTLRRCPARLGRPYRDCGRSVERGNRWQARTADRAPHGTAPPGRPTRVAPPPGRCRSDGAPPPCMEGAPRNIPDSRADPAWPDGRLV